MSHSHNPWIPPGQDTDEVETEDSSLQDQDPDLAITPTGPMLPQPGSGLPEGKGLELRPTTQNARLWWVGTHGGSGESTLAALMEGSCDAHHAWPVPANSSTGEVPVILTCRTNLLGLRSAQEALKQWASGAVPGVRLLGLVMSADAPGKSPRALKDFARLVAGGAPRVWDLPWIEEWRTDPPVTPSDHHGANRRVRRVIRSAEHLLN